jgi:hypothetical protein
MAARFGDLRASGAVRGGGMVLRTRHRFTAAYVETAWSVRRSSARARLTADVTFPSVGRGRSSVTAVLSDGSLRSIGFERRPLADVAYLYVRSRHGGYVVVPRTRPRAASLHLLAPRQQSSAPDPGPTLAVQIVREGRERRAAFSARVAPARGLEQAASVAAALK